MYNVYMEMLININQYRIAVIDDEEVYLVRMRKLMEQFFPNAVIDTFATMDEILAMDTRYTFAIIDVRLGDENGIDLSRQLGTKVSYVIYYSAYIEEIRRAFRYNTIGYLLKTDTDEEIRKLFAQYDSEYFSDVIRLRTENGEVSIPVRDILKVIKEERNIYIHLIGKNERIRIFGNTLNDVKMKSGGHLEFIHKSVLINIMQIKRMSVQSGEIVLADGSTEFASKRQRRPVYQMFLEKHSQ